MKMTMTRRRWLSLAAAGAAAGVAGATSAQAAVTMKVAAATINDAQHEWMKRFKVAVEARAGGRMKVELYPASQLGPIPRMVEGTAIGTIECFVTATSFLTGLDPRFEVFDVPSQLDDTAHGARAFADPQMRSAVFGFGGNRGLESIAVFYHSPQNLVSRKPVRALTDLAGQKIRVLSSPIQIDPMKKLGASPISLALSEVMPALQNGTIDGFVAASTVFSALKFYDAAKFQTQLPQWPVVTVAACNKAWLAGLPADLRAIVLEEAAKAEAPTNEFGAADIGRARDVWVQNGGQIIALSAQDNAAFAKLVGESAQEILKKSQPAKDAFDAYSALCRKYKA